MNRPVTAFFDDPDRLVTTSTDSGERQHAAMTAKSALISSSETALFTKCSDSTLEMVFKCAGGR